MSDLSPVNLWNHASEFLKAAEREFELASNSISMPAYFLAGRAIELAFKSYLLLKGADERALRAVGHDLSRARREAEAAGINEVVALDEQETFCIDWINDYYRSKDLEYPKTGFKSYPESRILLMCASKLVNGLCKGIRDWRPRKLGFIEPAETDT